MKGINRVAACLAFCLACSLVAQAQWEKKPYAEWSEKEAQKLLNDSPWGQTQVISDTSQMFGNERLGSGTSRVANVFHVNFRRATTVWARASFSPGSLTENRTSLQRAAIFISYRSCRRAAAGAAVRRVAPLAVRPGL